MSGAELRGARPMTEVPRRRSASNPSPPTLPIGNEPFATKLWSDAHPTMRRSQRSTSHALLPPLDRTISTVGTVALSIGHYDAVSEGETPAGVHTFAGDDDIEIEVVPLHDGTDQSPKRGKAARGAIFKLTGTASSGVSFRLWRGEVLVGQAHLLLPADASRRCTEQLKVYSVAGEGEAASAESEPIGEITVSFMMANKWKGLAEDIAGQPRPRFPWAQSRGVMIGHRGYGSTKNRFGVGENTILAFETAFRNGLRWSEFDVQLTKDNVSVLFHDLEIQAQGTDRKTVMKELMLSDLDDFEKRPPQLGQRIPRTRSMAGMPTGYEAQHKVEEYAVHEPFPTLQHVLQRVPMDMGFNVELKYAEMKHEEAHYVDRNMFVDSILDTVSRHVRRRSIVYSSFDPDICVLVKEKQADFPVLFLTEGGKEWRDDIRRNSLRAAIEWAELNQLDGVCALADLILNDGHDVVAELHRKGLILCTFGSRNNNAQDVQVQIDLGVNGIITDTLKSATRKE